MNADIVTCELCGAPAQVFAGPPTTRPIGHETQLGWVRCSDLICTSNLVGNPDEAGSQNR